MDRYIAHIYLHRGSVGLSRVQQDQDQNPKNLKEIVSKEGLKLWTVTVTAQIYVVAASEKELERLSPLEILVYRESNTAVEIIPFEEGISKPCIPEDTEIPVVGESHRIPSGIQSLTTPPNPQRMDRCRGWPPT